MYIFIACTVILVTGANVFNWAAQNRETSALGTDIPHDGYLLTTKEGQIFLIDRGNQSATHVLFAHGTAAWAGLWWPTLEAITAQGFRGTAFDMPPFGWTEYPTDNDLSRPRQAERVISLLEALGSKPIIVAHSVGAGPMAEAMLMRPDLVSGMILVSGAIALGSHKKPKDLTLPLRNDTLRHVATSATASNPYLTRLF